MVLGNSDGRINKVAEFVKGGRVKSKMLWSLLKITIDGKDVQDVSIDGNQVEKLSIDGNLVWSSSSGGTIVDDFEDGDISEYSGSTGSFSVQSNTVYEGSYALKQTSAWNEIESFPGDGLGTYPSRGDKFSIALRNEGGDTESNIKFYFGSIGSGDHYRVGFNCKTNEFELEKVSGYSSTVSSSQTSASVSYKEWYGVMIYFDTGGNGDITAELYESPSFNTKKASVTLNDSEYDGSGIGFRSTKYSYWDKIKIES